MAGSVLDGLRPAALWRHFEALAAIPRGSGNEAAAARFVLDWARERGLEAEQDAVGNVVVRVPATPGREGVATTVLQAHLDMVCEKDPAVAHDFERDGLRLRREGPWVMATGTTLGADNGIGVAAAMAVAEDPSAEHGPLELLFTVDEETGMGGAFGLAADFVRGRRMLNLDTEEEGSVYVGCAGGGDVIARFRFALEPRPGPGEAAFHRIEVRGLTGGHSGLDIHENRANAIKCLARVLDAVHGEGLEYRLGHVEGGSKRNAIPREAACGGCVPPAQAERLREVVAAVGRELAEEFAATDPGMAVTVEPRADCRCPGVLSLDDSRRLVRALVATPSGVLAMSRDVPGLVETSTNLGVVRSERAEGVLTVELVDCCRSAVASALEGVRGGLRALYALAGAEVEFDTPYPGWKPDLDSPLLAVALRVHEEVVGRPAEVKAVHAGLECGVIGERCPGMDMVSIGPDIRGAHSPAERVDAGSVARFYDYLKAVLAALE